MLGVTIMATGALRAMSALGALMLMAGGAWILFISLFSTLVQNLAPDWVRARVLAIFMLTFQGGMAGGSALWGVVAQHAGIQRALLWAGLGTVLTAALGLVSRLPDGPADVSPWNHWRMPVVTKALDVALDDGPVLVVVEYRVDADRRDGFLRAMHDYEYVRRRDGASRWGIYRDTADSDRFVETFLVHSWAEHLRQHARQTRGDRGLEETVRGFAHGEPQVRHLIDARHSRRPT